MLQLTRDPDLDLALLTLNIVQVQVRQNAVLCLTRVQTRKVLGRQVKAQGVYKYKCTDVYYILIDTVEYSHILVGYCIKIRIILCTLVLFLYLYTDTYTFT